MRKLSLPSVLVGLVIGILMSTGIVYAVVNFTVALTQAQVDDITWQWNQDDASHSTWSTGQLYMAFRISELTDRFHANKRANRATIIGGPFGYFCTNTWSGLSTGAKNAVCTTLGEASGCTACSIDGN